MKKEEKVICHVCKKEKKPYNIFIKSGDTLSMIRYKEAREKGEICQRCDQYYAITGEMKDATKQEFENAKKSQWFAEMMMKWWEKDGKLKHEDDGKYDKRNWEGTEFISAWCRRNLNKKVKK